MLLSTRHARVVRALLALALAALTGGRGGGVALACEAIGVAASSGRDTMADMPGMTRPAPTHDTSSEDGCDRSDGARECPLMLACAPALLTASPEGNRTASTRASIIEWRTESPTIGPLPPEPPPPRA